MMAKKKRCAHPDPRLVAWVFCRRCGYWREGVRVGDATDAALRETLRETMHAQKLTKNMAKTATD